MGPQSQSPSSTFKVKGCLTSGGRFSPSKRDVPVLRFKKERGRRSRHSCPCGAALAAGRLGVGGGEPQEQLPPRASAVSGASSQLRRRHPSPGSARTGTRTGESAFAGEPRKGVMRAAAAVPPGRERG